MRYKIKLFINRFNPNKHKRREIRKAIENKMTNKFSQQEKAQLRSFSQYHIQNDIKRLQKGKCVYWHSDCYAFCDKTILGSFVSIGCNVAIGPKEHSYNYLSAHPFFVSSFWRKFFNGGGGYLKKISQNLVKLVMMFG
ncbi:MAG: hypothetical protein LBQ37_03300 [Elusimicrobiota bacterium]|jgi:acetyltransferase-like isoleucine patch superfamily enzyme|nr:hypothetical protein [Elusimicrobiota bacterium]